MKNATAKTKPAAKSASTRTTATGKGAAGKTAAAPPMKKMATRKKSA